MPGVSQTRALQTHREFDCPLRPGHVQRPGGNAEVGEGRGVRGPDGADAQDGAEQADVLPALRPADGRTRRQRRILPDLTHGKKPRDFPKREVAARRRIMTRFWAVASIDDYLE